MDQEQQTDIFAQELKNLTNRFCDEYDLTYESMIGAMEVHKGRMLYQMVAQEIEMEEEED